MATLQTAQQDVPEPSGYQRQPLDVQGVDDLGLPESGVGTQPVP